LLQKNIIEIRIPDTRLLVETAPAKKLLAGPSPFKT